MIYTLYDELDYVDDISGVILLLDFTTELSTYTHIYTVQWMWVCLYLYNPHVLGKLCCEVIKDNFPGLCTVYDKGAR